MDRTEQRTTRTTHRSSSAAAARAVATNETYPSSSRRSNLTEAGVAGAAGAAVVGHRIDTTSDRMNLSFIPALGIHHQHPIFSSSSSYTLLVCTKVL